jgi:hypothetical protein
MTLDFFHPNLNKLQRILIYVMAIFLSDIQVALVCVRARAGGKEREKGERDKGILE